MRFALRASLVALMTVNLGLAAVGQTPAHKPLPWKEYCQPDNGFCFKYPGRWKTLGEIFDGNGVVLAPPQKTEEAFWDEVTVAMIAPPPQDGQPSLGLNGIIDQAAAGMRDAGQNFQTLQRQERTVDAKPAQMLKAQYRDKKTGRDWIEELVFIEGPDDEIYSVALKATPEDLPHLEPVFSEMLRTWRLPSPPVPDATGSETTAPAKAASPQAQ